jgi:hypothetical protein
MARQHSTPNEKLAFAKDTFVRRIEGGPLGMIDSLDDTCTLAFVRWGTAGPHEYVAVAVLRKPTEAEIDNLENQS